MTAAPWIADAPKASLESFIRYDEDVGFCILRYVCAAHWLEQQPECPDSFPRATDDMGQLLPFASDAPCQNTDIADVAPRYILQLQRGTRL